MNEKDLLKNRVKKKLEEGILRYFDKEKIDTKLEDCRIRIEYSRDEKFGDYSTPFALENKSILSRNPKEIAEGVILYLREESIFEKVDFTFPGFINFRIQKDYLIEYISNMPISPNALFPKVESPKKILFEFVSANPTGPLNIVSARAAAMGDSICSLLERVGNTVSREFYVNDYGNQVFLLGVSCLARIRETLGEPIQIEADDSEKSIEELFNGNFIPKEGYRGDYIKNLAEKFLNNPDKKKQILDHLVGKKYKEISEFLSLWCVEENLSGQKKDLESFGIHFDKFFSEKSLHDSGEVEKTRILLEKSGDVFTEDGKLFFRSTKFLDDKDRVIVREDGRPTYLLADIAYHTNKMQRGFDVMINIWGPDHHGYIARLKGAMKSLGYADESFQILIAQQVNLLSKGEKVKMSKRLGSFQTMSELLEYLGTNSKDVGRYFFEMRSLDVPLDFDLDLAKDESEKNPVFYLQYAHARICSIFREVGEDFDLQALKELEMTSERERLLFWCARFPEEVLDSANSFEPHRLANYLQNLSKVFTKFYSAKENRLKNSEGRVRHALSFLCRTTAVCLREGLKILGVSAPEKMSRNSDNE
ncbi:MAG: arginine--tRNA ligase [Leptospiraceae bacterium]|nr:arginine--tRNA ligase [Leptospiraceae bacterium]MCK6380915.1 arginine--tRNA ligase [Leptospiraceae bacterium]NUM40029.1 arginine--tRNA ligase [Leptospiraceae bacterium]